MSLIPPLPASSIVPFPSMSSHVTINSTSSPSIGDSQGTVMNRSPLKNVAHQQINSSTGGAAGSANKRPKVAVVPPALEYPLSVPVPTRAIVQALFEEAIKNDASDQTELAKAGLLSFSDVLLPAAAVQEEQVLKQLQAIAQRDSPTLTQHVVQCRKAVYDSVGAAMRAAATSRLARILVEQERAVDWYEQEQARVAEQAVAHAAVQQEQKALRQAAAVTAAHERKKKFPRNQELWREVAYLMTELSKLQKEERSWQAAAQNLQQRELELAVQEEEQAAGMREQEIGDKGQQHSSVEVPEIAMVQQTIQDITLSTVRIQQALDIVTTTVTESDKIRKDLYRRYRRDHQFHGYPGIKDPVGLLSALSQSQDF